MIWNLKWLLALMQQASVKKVQQHVNCSLPTLTSATGIARTWLLKGHCLQMIWRSCSSKWDPYSSSIARKLVMQSLGSYPRYKGSGWNAMSDCMSTRSLWLLYTSKFGKVLLTFWLFHLHQNLFCKSNNNSLSVKILFGIWPIGESFRFPFSLGCSYNMEFFLQVNQWFQVVLGWEPVSRLSKSIYFYYKHST